MSENKREPWEFDKYLPSLEDKSVGKYINNIYLIFIFNILFRDVPIFKMFVYIS